ncbi:MAG: hypothetical protein R6V58_09600 [Planctomycetota bacterium]
MKHAIRAVFIFAIGALPAVSGCVRIHQLVKINHDGSGTLTETITVLPRAVRMLEGHAKRAGEGEDGFALLAEEALKKRTKSFGGVTLKSKERKTLPDGSRTLKTVFEFKDINQVHLHIAPTFRCAEKGRTGSLRLRYRRVVRGHGRNPKYYKKDQVDVMYDRYPTQKKYSAPSIQRQSRDVAPMFQDMLREFRFEIQIEAPDDIETFDDRRHMIRAMPFDRDVVTPYRITGEDVAANPELIRGLLLGEFGGTSDAWGGQLRRVELDMPNTHTPYGSPYGGMHVHFFKSVEVPKPGAKEEQE